MDKINKLDIFKIRILRAMKLTLVVGGIMLLLAVLAFNFMASMIEYVGTMVNYGDNQIFKIMVFMLRYGIALVIVSLFSYWLMSGEWDLGYKLICRHKDKDTKYKYNGGHLEKIESIQIYRNGQYKDIDVLSLMKVYEYEKQRCLFCKINNYYMLIRDVDVQSADGDTLVVHEYEYTGKSMIENDKVYGYTFQVIKSVNEEPGTYRRASEEYTQYFRNCMETNEVDIKDSFQEDLDAGKKIAKRVLIALGIIWVGYVGVNFYRSKVVKAQIEFNGITVESVVSGVPVLFDSEDDTWLMSYINSNLTHLDTSILEAFKNDGWKIRITNKDMRETGFYFGLMSDKEITGATSFPYKYIIIPNNVESIDASIIHEMGHYIDHFDYTTTDGWLEVYNAEKDKYLRNYSRSNKFEGFACVFMEYVIVGSSLKKRAPETYEYIKNLLEEKYDIQYDEEG